MRMNFFAIHWNDEGIQHLIDMTDAVEQDLLNRLKSVKDRPQDYSFAWMMLQANHTPEKNPKVYGFQSQHDLAFLEYVWKTDPNTLIKGVLKSGILMLEDKH